MNTRGSNSTEIAPAGAKVIYLNHDAKPESTELKAAKQKEAQRASNAAGKTRLQEKRFDGFDIAYGIFRSCIALGIAVGHVPFRSTDVHIGPVPVPFAPIEVIVDLNNENAHHAQGYPKPEGDLVLSIEGRAKGDVPTDFTYDTDGASILRLTENKNGDIDQMHPGLYGVSLAANPHCEQIKGRFMGDDVAVFSNDARLRGESPVTAELLGPYDIEICLTDGIEQPNKAVTVYLYESSTPS